MVCIVTEFLRCGESFERRVWNSLAWGTERYGQIDNFTGGFVKDEAMNENIKVICRGLGVCLGQETIVTKFPHTAFDIFFHKGTKTGYLKETFVRKGNGSMKTRKQRTIAAWWCLFDTVRLLSMWHPRVTKPYDLSSEEMQSAA
jgi:hypothetical protein